MCDEVYSTASYLYDLPINQIAPFPLKDRSSSRLLVLNRESGKIADTAFNGLHTFLKEGDLIVLNDSRVINARLSAKKKNGGKVEVFLVRPHKGDGGKYDVNSTMWDVLISPSRSIHTGQLLELEEMELGIIDKAGDGIFTVDFKAEKLKNDWNIKDFLKRAGEVPLPPYIKRRRALDDCKESSFSEDEDRYQNVFAVNDGSVAAPTAGFHFDENYLEKLKSMGVRFAFLTLHVGLGTFKPIKVRDIRDHKMDREWFFIPEHTKVEILKAKERGKKVIAVGTTSVRVLESVFSANARGQYGFTELFIYPGFDFKVVDAIVTNFHLPCSTLILLVSAFAGRNGIMKAYDHAKAAGYRFYSYGDAMLIC